MTTTYTREEIVRAYISMSRNRTTPPGPHGICDEADRLRNSPEFSEADVYHIIEEYLMQNHGKIICDHSVLADLIREKKERG